MTGSRRQAREAALQILYLTDVCRKGVEEIPDAAWADEPLSPKARAFTLHLASGVTASLARIDPLLTRYAENWELSRMAAIDRCPLRMATFELLNDIETP